MSDEHYHCPHDCEHPQPFIATRVSDGVEMLVCGRCWCVNHIETPMVLCTPATCPDEHYP